MSKQFAIKTRPWKITMIVLSLIIIFLLIIILIGELDVLDVDYIVAKNGVLWSGKVTETNFNWLLDHYSQYGVTEQMLLEWLNNKPCVIHNLTNMSILNPLLFAYLSGGLLLSFLIPFILKLCKFVWWDVLPFSLAIGISCFIFIISSLIEYWENNQIWWYLLRIFIFIISLVVSFIICNTIVKQCVKNSTYSSQYINELKSEKRASDKAMQQSKQVLDAYHKQKKENEITYVEVDNNDNKKDK